MAEDDVGGRGDMGSDDELERRLVAAAEAVRERELLGQRCEEMGHRLFRLRKEIATLRDEHAAELEDVERLEALTLTRVLASLSGDRRDKLARERSEADAVALRVQVAEDTYAALEEDYGATRDRWEALAGAPAGYAAALDDKETALARPGDGPGPRIMELADERGRLSGELRQLGEALEAAAAARRSLHRMQDRLDAASRWSTYDTAFGGGMVGSAVKHSRLDEAATAAAQVDRQLATLRLELVDVGMIHFTTPNVDITRGTRFVDIWLDNMFTDWAVQNRIEQAHQTVGTNLGMIDQLTALLERRAATTRTRLDALTAERHDILTQNPA